MDEKEFSKIIKTTTEVFSIIQSATIENRAKTNEIESLNKQIIEKDEALRKYKKDYLEHRLLLSFYEKEGGKMLIELCPECHGSGAIEIDVGEEVDVQPCETCNQTGYLKVKKQSEKVQ